MEDRIINSYIESFKDDFNIVETNYNVLFEYFVNYCMISKHIPEIFRDDNLMYQKVHTGCGGDYGIDGLAIYINNSIYVNSVEQAKEAIGTSPFSVSFVFVQAKTASKFESGDMLKTGNGVRNLFRDKTINANDYIRRAHSVIDYIISRSSDMSMEPTCHIYYATMGKWVDDPFLMQTIDNIKSDIVSMEMFSRVEFIPKDANDIKLSYKEIRNTIQKKISMSRCVPFPKIPGVNQAFLGLVALKDYINFITDSDGNLQNSLFFDNVRSYLGDNAVNLEIKKTLCDSCKNIQFPILNNGVTIVAKTLDHPGEEFIVSDFQIVNGCQTSNVIYYYGRDIESDVYIPVKIINTQDSDVINSIIKSTNSQTEVKREAFESLKPFHKNLQAYYDTFNEKNRLYYERRAREYCCGSNTSIASHQVITLASQLYSFVSMFLEEPHSTHRYYGELLKSKGSRVFNETHIVKAYYTSALCLTKINRAIKTNLIPRNLIKYRYQFLLVYRYVICGDDRLRPNSHEMDRACDKILASLNNENNNNATIKRAVEIIREAICKMPEADDLNPNFRRKEFTVVLKMFFNVKTELRTMK